MHTLVLGIGNTLLTDEGVGVHAIAYLQQHHANLPDTEYVDGGTLSFTLAGVIEQARNLIIIDATQLHAKAGTVRTFVGKEMDSFLNHNRKSSVHEVSLMDLLSIAALADQLPVQRALIGIQPQVIDWGETPSADVQAAIPLACAQAIALIEAWQQ
jgi:hydrogenase maturation protease